MADTALTIITDALLDLGVLADEETPTASQAAGALRKLNNMIESWNIQEYMGFATQDNVFPLDGSVSYTLGTGGDFNMPRPDIIYAATLRNTSLPPSQQLDYVLEFLNDQEYANIALKGLNPSLAQYIYINTGYPLSEVFLYPIPSTGIYSLVLWTNTLLSSLTLNQQILLPHGYKRALTANLVIELAPSYGVEPSNTVIKIAQDSLADIKTKNFQLNTLEIDDRLVRQQKPWNYLTGGY